MKIKEIRILNNYYRLACKIMGMEPTKFLTGGGVYYLSHTCKNCGKMIDTTLVVRGSLCEDCLEDNNLTT